MSIPWKQGEVIMGMYDCRCMVTGVSLKGSDASLVLLQQSDQGFVPIALAVHGTYNRLGSIDGIKNEHNARIILDYFQKEITDGEFVVNAEYFQGMDCYPIEELEHLLACFERNINDLHTAAVLNGTPVVFALIYKEVWQAIATDGLPVDDKLEDLFEQVFADNAVAAGLYEKQVPKVAQPLREMAAICAFLSARGIAWHPADHPGQDYGEEMRQYLEEARTTFSDSPVILGALDDYEEEVADLLQDD
jgi:hypothetical protein